jgi:hypothetical protein
MNNHLKNVLFAGLLFITSNAFVQTIQPYIRIDQFGYRPGDKKVAVIADPKVGFNANEEFIPGELYQVRSAKDHSVVFEGRPAVWNNGTTCEQSGDRGWWFDFSQVSDIGSYYVYDMEKEVASFTFDIQPDIYKNMLKAATKMFYYQRLGIEKNAKYVGEKWADGFQQPMDSICRDIFDKDNPEKIRDHRGGWMDAGDQNKYTTFTVQPVHQLLSAYTQNPEVFTDDFDIPESGNGIPDILDEVKWQLDWLKRMQDTIDGGAYIKMGGKVSFPLSLDTNPKYYFSPKSTAATIVVSSMMAHAYLVYKEIPEFYDYAQDCKKRALQAWEFFHNTPMNFDIDDGSLGGGRANRNRTVQEGEALVAAIYLFAATGEQEFHDYILENYKAPNNWGVYDTHWPKSYLFYAFLPNADMGLAMKIISQKAESYQHNAGGWTKWDEKKDLYRAFMPNPQYHWGSNQPKANIGNTLSHFLSYYILPEKRTEIKDHTLNFLHYFHGVNPMGITYLTNMQEFGADSCAKFVWHKWFNPHHAPPGYIPGGPNKNHTIDSSYPGDFSPPQNQPHQKSFRDWVEDWRTYPWEVTEPAIYYQAAYVYLVSNFAQVEEESVSEIDSLKIFHIEADSLYANVQRSLFVRKYPLLAWNLKVTWYSSDTLIAIVDSLGTITPLKEGSVQITAMAENGARDSVMVHIKACSSTPFNEEPHIIPGIIEAEEFDKGCNTYFDTDPVNSGRMLRPDEGVDIEITGDDRGTYNVGWIHAGEWLKYTVNVTKSDTYIVDCRVAAIKPSELKIEFSDGSHFNSSIQFPPSGGYQNWYSHYSPPIELAEGQNTMTVSFLSDGFNINHLVFYPYVPVEGVDIQSDTLNLLITQTEELVAKVIGGEGVITEVRWSTADPLIATVNASGLVRGIAEGITHITATSAVDALTDSVVVVVSRDYTSANKPDPSVIRLYPNPVTNGRFTLELPQHASKQLLVRITDILGKEVYRNEFHFDALDPLQIEAELNNGIYIISVMGENYSFVKKVVYQK